MDLEHDRGKSNECKEISKYKKSKKKIIDSEKNTEFVKKKDTSTVLLQLTS